MPAGEVQLADDQFIQPVLDQADGHLVDREVLVLLLDHGLDRHVAEQGDLGAIVAGERVFGAADEDVGLNADLAQLADRVLGGLGLQFVGGLQVGHQRQVDVEAVLLAEVERELADGFEEGLAFDVAHGAADLGNHDVDALAGRLGQGAFDLVGDVRDDLDRLAEVFAAAFLLDHRLVDLAGGVVRVAIEGGVGESLVVAQVEVGLAAVVEDEDLAVLVGAHGARIDVDIGVELLHADRETAAFEQHADRGGRQSLAQGADDAAGDEDVFGHESTVLVKEEADSLESANGPF